MESRKIVLSHRETIMARTVKVTDLAGVNLDIMVATCSGIEVLIAEHGAEGARSCFVYGSGQRGASVRYCPSAQWCDGGPIIEREGIDTRQIKRRSHELLEMRHFCADKGDLIVRPPGWNRDMVHRPLKPGSLQGMWLARLANSSDTTVIWSIERDFLGPTLLVAAMRCYVASKRGPVVEVSDELAGFDAIPPKGVRDRT